MFLYSAYIIEGLKLRQAEPAINYLNPLYYLMVKLTIRIYGEELMNRLMKIIFLVFLCKAI
jgi:hypothetical protein